VVDLVRLSFGLLVAVIAAPPLLGVVIPFSVNVLVTSFLIIYIGCHLSMDPDLGAEDEVGCRTPPVSACAWVSSPCCAGLLLCGSLVVVCEFSVQL
jgi:hypothetical protein